VGREVCRAGKSVRQNGERSGMSELGKEVLYVRMVREG
jgi:hypothetical protein